MVISVRTSDSVIWNFEKIISDICLGMANKSNIQIDLLNEGPALMETGLYQYIEYCANLFKYDLTKVTIRTCNKLEKHSLINIIYKAPTHFIINTVNDLKNIHIDKVSTMKHFGLFIGRSNAPRLKVSTLLNNITSSIVQSFHYDYSNDFHTANIGIEDVIRDYGQKDLTKEVEFLNKCPITLDDNKVTYPMLMDQHNNIHSYYSNFFVEVVCETYFKGKTFFPTEKIWRPIILKTPYIVQGPQWFLRNLKELGFRTFDCWWDEGYSEDPHNHSLLEIEQVLRYISSKTPKQLQQMYYEMNKVLEHNYNTLIELKNNYE